MKPSSELLCHAGSFVVVVVAAAAAAAGSAAEKAARGIQSTPAETSTSVGAQSTRRARTLSATCSR